MRRAPIATPTPIPAFAPVERPSDLSDEEFEVDVDVELEEAALPVPKASWYWWRGADAGWKASSSELCQATVTATISNRMGVCQTLVLPFEMLVAELTGAAWL